VGVTEGDGSNNGGSQREKPYRMYFLVERETGGLRKTKESGFKHSRAKVGKVLLRTDGQNFVE